MLKNYAIQMLKRPPLKRVSICCIVARTITRASRMTYDTTKSWNESEVLVDRKSKFQARCCALKKQDDIPLLLQQLVEGNKMVSKASHKHMFAWRTGEVVGEESSKEKGKKKGKKHGGIVLSNVQQGSNDCGEAGAGQRLLTLLERSSLVNVLVIVTRWYGGTALGPARFRHISTTAVESLKKGRFLL